MKVAHDVYFARTAFTESLANRFPSSAKCRHAAEYRAS